MRRDFTLFEGLMALTFPLRIWFLVIFMRWGFTGIEKDIVIDTIREEDARREEEGRGGKQPSGGVPPQNRGEKMTSPPSMWLTLSTGTQVAITIKKQADQLVIVASPPTRLSDAETVELSNTLTKGLREVVR